MHILVVCTGNTCRSPLVERWLAHLLADTDVQVTSAGLLGWNGHPASPHSAAVAEGRGVSLDGHRSRRIAAADVRDADLVVAMTRDHAWGVAALDADAAQRTFLLPEAVRRADAIGARRGGEAPAWVAQVADGRDHRRPGRPTDELADPAGQPLAVYETLAMRVEPLVTDLAALVR